MVLGAWELVGGAWSFDVSFPPCMQMLEELFRLLQHLPCLGEGLLCRGNGCSGFVDSLTSAFC